MKTTNERLKFAFDHLKKTQRIKYKDWAEMIDTSPQNISNMLAGTVSPSEKLLNLLQEKYRIGRRWILEGAGAPPGSGENYIDNSFDPTSTVQEDVVVPSKVTGQDIRQQKAFAGRKQKGLLAVPIKAQAGYARMLHDDFRVFIDQLDRVIIPDFPYDGDEFRMFQVEGDSMEYVNEHGRVAGLQNGIWVVGQVVPQEDWKENLSLYRVHVIVLSRQILIKRILQDNPNEIILHSDNEEMHPQERISLKDVKEIWYVVRKLDWDMPPPRRIEIRA